MRYNLGYRSFFCKTAALLVLSVSLVFCGTEDDSNTATSAATTSDSSLATAYPSSLALTVFPKDDALSLNEGDDKDDSFDPNAKPLKEKIADQEKIANGTADSCLPPALHREIKSFDEEVCYEFDQDMMYGTNDSSQSPVRWLGTKNGKNSLGEACLVAFTRSQVSQVIAMVDQTLGFGMSALCQYKKDHTTVELPAVGESIDLAPSMSALFADKLTVTSASLERLDDSESFPVYRVVVKASLTKENITRTIGVIHSPHNDSNTAYKGTMYTIMEGLPEFGGPPPKNTLHVAQTDKYQIMSIVYERTLSEGTPHLTAELRSAQVAKDLAPEAITSAGVLDLNVGTNIATATLGDQNYGSYSGYQQSNEAISGITFVAFSLNPNSNEGTLAYWKNPGGNYYENARGFNIAITENTSNQQLEGCATSGSASIDFNQGISIRRYLNPAEADNALTLSPKGFWHPFMNTPSAESSVDGETVFEKAQQSGQSTTWYAPKVNDTALATSFASDSEGSLITRQCFAYNSTSALYEIDTTQISTPAGYELVDTGASVNAGKFVKLPPPVRPPAENVRKL